MIDIQNNQKRNNNDECIAINNGYINRIKLGAKTIHYTLDWFNKSTLRVLLISFRLQISRYMLRKFIDNRKEKVRDSSA